MTKLAFLSRLLPAAFGFSLFLAKADAGPVAYTVIDLSAPSFTNSEAHGADGGLQVGSISGGSLGSGGHAAIWSGSAGSLGRAQK